MDTGLKGRGVLVTGGAGGIGTATVRAFAEEGARVAVHYRTEGGEAQALAREVGGVALRADLTSEAEVDALIPQAVKALGRLDVVVANAGHWPAAGRARVAHVPGALAPHAGGEPGQRVPHAAGPSCATWRRRRRAAWCSISSTAGLFGEAGHADYAAAKGALANGFVKSLKNELGRIAPLAPRERGVPGVDGGGAQPRASSRTRRSSRA